MDASTTLVLMLATVRVSVQGLTITNQVSTCKVETDQGTVDFSALAGTATNPRFTGIQSSVIPMSRTYDWNPCLDFSETSEQTSQNCQDVALCRLDNFVGPSGTTYTGTGTQLSSKFFVNQGNALELQIANQDSTTVAHIVLICSLGADNVECVDDSDITAPQPNEQEQADRGWKRAWNSVDQLKRQQTLGKLRTDLEARSAISITGFAPTCSSLVCPLVMWSSPVVNTSGNFTLTSSAKNTTNNYLSFAFATGTKMEDALLVVDCYEPNGTVALGTSRNVLLASKAPDNVDDPTRAAEVILRSATKINGVMQCSFSMKFPPDWAVRVFLAEGSMRTNSGDVPLKKKQHDMHYVSSNQLSDLLSAATITPRNGKMRLQLSLLCFSAQLIASALLLTAAFGW